ncbi:hypothetical protein [Streptomyces brevispora]|uniref:Uncharacterized protein n=1 Tax=Streptomyces brevispora TaxID=887462 RepID=A0ABZ1G4M7_9ACTN|nr:hypothetical protein [Streptomyces brevispora]WSC14762.1 hypothetical protein OIE64_19260 [Streptomyces brevispora]
MFLGDGGIAWEAAPRGPSCDGTTPAPERRAALWVETARADSRQSRPVDGYRDLRVAESCAAPDIRRPAIQGLIADMAARDRRRTLPQLHLFRRQLGVPA